MSTSRRLAKFVPAIALVALAVPTAAFGQASRTWVSGVGDDVNPCSRTAPCKTFAGAISKTAAGGQISVLDPGGFGAVTITKSMTIDGAGTLASALSTTNGIVISAATTDHVILRNLQIDGVGAGTNGIVVNTAKSVVVDNVVITNFLGSPGKGIVAQPSASAVNIFLNNVQINNVASNGIHANPGASGTV